jgi:ABC-type Fe3+ transport system substrate-binding protein
MNQGAKRSLIRGKRKAVSTTLAVVMVVIVLVVAAAGGYLIGSSKITTVIMTTSVTTSVTASPTTTITSASQTNSSAQSALVTQAEQECATANPCLTIYNGQDSFTWADYYAASFYALYPWATGKVDWDAESSSQVGTQALSQYQAGKVTADVIEVGGSILIPLIQAGAIQNYTDPEVQSQSYFTNGTYDPEGGWVGLNYQTDVIAYNTNLVNASELPANYSSPQTVFSVLSNSTFKGVVAFQSATTLSISGAPFYYLYTTMGNSSGQWTSLMDQIAANKPTITSNSGATASDIADGTASIGIVGYEDVLTEEAAGAPMSMVISNPLLGTLSTVAIAKDAPHPAMAELMEQWWTSPVGQLGLAASGRAPLDQQVGLQYDLVPNGTTLVNCIPNFSVYSDATAWSSTFMSIFGA